MDPCQSLTDPQGSADHSLGNTDPEYPTRVWAVHYIHCSHLHDHHLLDGSPHVTCLALNSFHWMRRQAGGKRGGGGSGGGDQERGEGRGERGEGRDGDRNRNRQFI